MSKLSYIFLFWIKVMAVMSVLMTGLAFVLLLVYGAWGEVSFVTIISYALISGVANGLLLGTIAALWMGYRTWRVVARNKKIVQRKQAVRKMKI